ncbi:MAG: radical SAM family heme chaperone HemW [Candidatus Hatepunaea meridiana]|nr:radical SAM family heme chaperone HemW [Candidatus Hatepunaea meridiana]
MNEFALYIHYPFCIKRCHYCGFASAVYNRSQAVNYHKALLKEIAIQSRQQPWQDGTLRSIYFGGGTPSLMSSEAIIELLNVIRKSFTYPPEIEVTIEANPGASDRKRFNAFRKAGINRLSIGAQSFNDDELKLLGRIHSAKDIYTAVKKASSAGFNNISLDLIYGIPGQTVKSFLISVHRALDLNIQHLSTYALTIEEKTRFAQMINYGTLSQPDSDLAAEQYLELCKIMKQAGFYHYELTNFARPDYQSQHNWTYWRRIPYLGVGTAAHSFDGKRRFWNPRNTDQYIRRVNTPENGIEEELLTEYEELEEKVYLSLRTSDGLEMEIAQRISSSEAIEELLTNRFLKSRDNRLFVPEEKWLLLDEIVLKLLSSNKKF